MNNGILVSLNNNVVDSNYITLFKSDRYDAVERLKNSTILGQTRSSGIINTDGSTISNNTNIGIIYNPYGILPFPYKNNSTLDYNSFIYVIDTASKTYGSSLEYPLPYIIMGFRYRGGNGGVVDWGDGTVEVYNTSVIAHTYRNHGIYYVQVKQTNNFQNVYNPSSDGRNEFRDGKCLGLLSWPTTMTTIPDFSFWNRLDFLPRFLPTGITSLNLSSIGLNVSVGISRSTNPQLQNIEFWDVSNCTTITFARTPAMNRDLSNWKFNSGLTSLNSCFFSDFNFVEAGYGEFNNGDPPPTITSIGTVLPSGYVPGERLNSWDTSNITNMGNMFYGQIFFNQNLSGWNVSKVNNFSNMFYNPFNTVHCFDGDLTGWQLVASGTTCAGMFGGTNRLRAFTGKGCGTWNTSGVTNMDSMFQYNNNFNANLSGWNTNNVTTMQQMFYGSSAFKGSGLENWNLAGLNSSTSLDNFAFGCDFPSGQYDLILNSWNTNKASGVNGIANWRTDLKPHFGSSKYTAAGSGARASLISYGWTITDGGLQT